MDKKIELLNNLSGETLTFVFYTAWQLTSYGENSLFGIGGCIGAIGGQTFRECVDNAMKAVKERLQ